MESSLLFAMSGDGQTDVTIPIVFLFYKEGQRLLEAAYEYPELQVLLTYTPKSDGTSAPLCSGSDIYSHITPR